MSVYIKGMEMPRSCWACYFQDCGNCLLNNHKVVDKCIIEERIDDDCPLIPVPEHGRLIEESKVLDIVSEWCPDDDGSVGKYGDLREMLDEIEALPTIIPESKEDE